MRIEMDPEQQQAEIALLKKRIKQLEDINEA
jgi:hypothetical protein